MNIVHTHDIDDAFFEKLAEICIQLGARPFDMLSVMFSESGCRADAWNDNPKNLPPEKRWNASGLIQFMPFILPGIGWRQGHAAFRQLSATDQLVYVRRYYAPHKGMLGSVGALYTATFLPALLKYAGDPAFVLTAKDGPLGWAYAPNAAFDANHDYAITVGELENAVRRNCRGPRWLELRARLEDRDAPDDDLVLEGFDLRTTFGLQRALERLGYSPGPLDGIPGPKTSAAIAAFQKDHPPLAVDGIYGPRTREMLDLALRTMA